MRYVCKAGIIILLAYIAVCATRVRFTAGSCRTVRSNSARPMSDRKVYAQTGVDFA